MDTLILDGKKISQKIRQELKEKVAALEKKPGLAVVLVGNDPASMVYVSHKEKACYELGFYSEKIVLPESVSEDELFSVIQRLNDDPKIHGILVQFPLPKRLQHLEERIASLINPGKDVDGFHPINSGLLTSALAKTNNRTLVPCTPKGVIRIMKEYGITIEGKHAVVIGRSNLVGKPVSMLLLAENATVTICHSRTRNIREITRTADILVAAIGKAEFVDETYVKEGAVVIDVGINRVGKKLLGDVKYEAVKKIASAITPVPGGIGPMTIAMLMDNVYNAYLNLSGIPDIK